MTWYVYARGGYIATIRPAAGITEAQIRATFPYAEIRISGEIGTVDCWAAPPARRRRETRRRSERHRRLDGLIRVREE